MISMESFRACKHFSSAEIIHGHWTDSVDLYAVDSIGMRTQIVRACIHFLRSNKSSLKIGSASIRQAGAVEEAAEKDSRSSENSKLLPQVNVFHKCREGRRNFHCILPELVVGSTPSILDISADAAI